MELTIENYLKFNEVITPVQYVEAGQERSYLMHIFCKEYLEKIADIVSYSENTLGDIAEITVKFRKDCCLVFEKDTYQGSTKYTVWQVIKATEIEGETNEKH